MNMNEKDDLATIKEELRTEKERVAKLKAIVIREKKANSNLTVEVERLSSSLNELKHKNASLLSELEQLRIASTSNALSEGETQSYHSENESVRHELKEKLPNAQRELPTSLVQLEGKNALLNELPEERNEVKSQLLVSKANEQNCISIIGQLESELSAVRSQLDEKDQLLMKSVAREKTLLAELDVIKTQQLMANKIELQDLNDLVAELKEREIKTASQLKEQELQSKQLSEALSKLREEFTAQESSLNETTTKLHQANQLIENLKTQGEMSQKAACLIDRTHSYPLKIGSAVPIDICREFFKYSQPFVEAVTTEDSDFQMTEAEFSCLLDHCTQLLSFSHLLTPDINELERLRRSAIEPAQTPLPHNSTPSVRTEQGTQFDATLVDLTNCHTLSVDATSKYDYPEPHSVSPVLTEIRTHESRDQIDHTENTDRLHMLEVKVSDLEKYAAEQVDRAKSQMIDWSQKLELQAADYDHLIRDKEAEISELRETCDRLSDEVSIYSNFCSSVMLYVRDSGSRSDEQVVDWLSIADALNSNESPMSGYELSGLLGTLFQELKSQLEQMSGLTGSRLQSSSESMVSREPDNSQYEHDEMKEQLAVIKKALEQADKRAADAETSASELQQELQKRDEKIQRMKQLLIRLKLDASGQQKAAANVEEVESARQRLTTELECRTKELEESNVAKEHAESALLTAQEELTQLRLVIDNVKEERDSTIRRLNKVQSEFNAYKVKALHTLRNSHPHDPLSSTSVSDLIVSNSVQSDESASPNDSGMHKAELELLTNQLSTTQQRMEEASLRASLARTECDLVKEELAELKQKYNELLKEFREQRTLWESKLASLTRERERATDDRIRDLTEKLDEARTQFEEQLQCEQSRHQRMMQDERTLWTAKLDKAASENKSLQEELDNIRRNVNAFNGSVVASKHLVPVQNQSMDMTAFSPRHVRSRMQGDGADNVTDESDAFSGSQLSSGHSGGFEDRQKLDTPRPLILPLDQLLSSSNMNARTLTSIPSMGGSLSPLHHSGDIELNGALGHPVSTSASASSQIAGLRVALSNQQRRVEHLSELLNESEANAARLEEQAKVLKEEIRRLERVAQRESQLALPSPVNDSPTPVSNSHTKDSQLRTEYLKNVVLKLICSPTDCAERPQLISVLSSLLLLSPSEQKALQDGVASSQSAPGGVSWTSYLVGWTSSKG